MPALFRRLAPNILFVLTLLLLCSCRSPQKSPFVHEADRESPIRVACVGDSITYGFGIPDREHNSYPAQLGRLLGPHWDVRNFGVSGATVLKNGNKPYWLESAFQDALTYEPDVVIIKLGTNDTKPDNWAHKNEFVGDLEAMIHSFQQLDSRPRVYLCHPVPAFPERWGIRDEVIQGEVIPLIDRAADDSGVPVIDLYSALSGKGEYFPDKIHPDARGAGLMASAIYSALTGRHASLSQELVP